MTNAAETNEDACESELGHLESNTASIKSGDMPDRNSPEARNAWEQRSGQMKEAANRGVLRSG
jgi:hypothetical protein